MRSENRSQNYTEFIRLTYLFIQIDYWMNIPTHINKSSSVQYVTVITQQTQQEYKSIRSAETRKQTR